MSPPCPTRVRLTNVSDEDLLMADPFSIAVGALTVAGIARSVGKAVRKLHAFKTAQGDFSALQNEVSDVEAVLQQVASVTYSPVLPGQEEQSDITLRGHIDRAKGQLLELEKLIAYVLTSYDDQAKAKVDKSAWLKQQNKLRSLRKGLRNVRMNLALSIATVTLSIVSRVELSLERISSNQDRTSSLFNGFISQISTATGDTQGLGTNEIKSGSCIDLLRRPSHSPNVNSDNDKMASPATRSQSSGRTQGNNYLDYEMPPESICLMLRSRRYRISCTRSCLCVCHQKKFFRLSYPFANVLGNLFGGYSGLPLITPACNASRCLRGSAAIDINYYFPISYFERILRASVAISSNGISQSISMTRVRDWYCPLWQYTRDSEKVGIQALFDTGRASPYDVNVFGQSALHVNVIRSARRFSTTNIAGESVSGTLKLDLCQFLIQQGADPYLQDKNGRRPIDHAWENILSHRLLPKDEARLIVMFQDPDYIDNRQFTSIHKIVIGLLDRPLALEIKDRIVDIDAVDAHGKTAVAWAAARKERATLQTLLEAGANPDIIDNERYTAIFHAAEAPDPGCVSLLLEHRSNLNHMDALGATAFHRACEADNDPCLLEPFITGGININLHQGRSGDTGLAGASREGRLSNVCYLLDKKANPNVVNAAGETAIFMAIHHNRPKILERLLHTGASPNICNRKGQSILHSAARLGKPDVLMILQDIDYGDIDPELEDDNKMKAVDYFAERQKIVNVDPEVQRAFRELMKIANAKYRSE